MDLQVFTLTFRQDLVSERSSWGLGCKLPQKADFVFANESFPFRDGKELSAFVETTRFLGAKSRVSLRGIGGRRFGGVRTFFTPDRSGAVSGFEIPDRERRMFVTLTVEGQS